jgi:AcrR family transcriptional regulator
MVLMVLMVDSSLQGERSFSVDRRYDRTMVLSVKGDVEVGHKSRATTGVRVRVPKAADSGAELSRVLDAAEALFYAHGIQAVGMDDIRDRSRVALKRLYQCFPSKEKLVVAMLERRDARWRERLSAYVNGVDEPEDRILAVFDWLGEWFAEPGFRGCAWINSYGELGAVSAPVAEQARLHKTAFKDYLDQLVADATLPPALTGQLALLAEGAMATAGIFATVSPASEARTAAETLIRAVSGKTR